MLDQLAAQNSRLQKQLAKEARYRMDQALEQAVPEFREIDKNPRWHRWLLGIDVLSSRVRQTLLNEAISAGNASRVIAFFRQFQQEDGGGTSQTYSSNRQAGSYYGKPIYTRESIGQLYEMHRRGDFKNREAEWSKIEQDIFDAQKTGRVSGVYLTK
jgi:hypothetical protein